MEEMKKRYYDIINTVNEIRDVHVERLEFDAGNETRRKEQLNKLWNRTEEQVSPSAHWHKCRAPREGSEFQGNRQETKNCLKKKF